MTLSNCYITIDDIRERAGIPDTGDDDVLEPAVTSACRAIDVWCAQIFYDTGSASAKTFRPMDPYCVEVIPFSTTSGLIIATDLNYDGTYETTWAATDYELEEFGGDYSTTLGTVPYTKIRAVGANIFPTPIYGRAGGGWPGGLMLRRKTLQVTARWGWSTPPDSVKEATKILAVDLWKRKDVPFGIATGTMDFGGLRIGRDVMAQVSSLLTPYHVHPVMVG